MNDKLDKANKELVFQNEEKAKQAEKLQFQTIRAINNEKKLQASFMETIGIARLLVELRDPYTAGHQKHVGDLAKAIAADLGFDAHYQEGIMIAGYLHDIGKIIVPIDILSKPGKLTHEEFNLVKNHAQAGYEIIKNLNFPWDIVQGVWEHHERLDGSGYPRRLKGDEISIDGRILAVADVVDAMSSFRPYRASLGIKKALDEIERGRNTLYDATVVDVCLKFFQDKSYQFE
jgi:putative nucleotidyltransferase with HDIG domain